MLALEYRLVGERYLARESDLGGELVAYMLLHKLSSDDEIEA